MINDLTKRLYAEGWTREHHPDCVCLGDFENFGYKWGYLLSMCWKVPCGLFVSGRSVATSDTTYDGMWYCPENGNPLLRCPYERKDCEHALKGVPFAWCQCVQTEEPYEYSNSAERIEEEHDRKQHAAYMEITGGQYCACVEGGNGFDGGMVKAKYDVDGCIRYGCKNEFCSIRKQPRDLSRVNIFYDIRRMWHTKRGLVEETRTEIEKGVRVFEKPVARTDAEIWLKMKQAQYDPIQGKHVISPKLKLKDHAQEHFSKYHRKWMEYEYFEFHYEVENIRIEARDTRDLLQDLRDVSDGIEVVHAVDLEKAAKQKKADRKKEREAYKERRKKIRLKEQILQADEKLAQMLKRTAIDMLGREEAEALYRQRADKAEGIAEQIGMFD